jgi:hypothetical protein
MSEKLSMCQVRLKPIPATLSGELSDKVFRKCCFCEKNCESVSTQSQLIDRLSGPGNFYCSFCLRHGLNNKGGRDVLILSFRSIIGYFYFQNYIQANNGQKLWISQIEDYIDSHYRAGSVNPLFLYDPDTMLWFVNFSKIGNTKKKVPVEEVAKTIVSILTTFNLSETAPGVSMSSLYTKYKDAVDGFYRKRFRPADRRMLIPTLCNTGVVEPKTSSLDKMRNFVFDDLKAKK